MPKVLICGSRSPITKAMKKMAFDLVKAAISTGNDIIVGDAPGIDTQVILACQEFGANYTIYGGYNKIRVTGRNAKYIRVDGNYLARDRMMVEAADRVVGVWNGKSRGTIYTVSYSKRLGKPTFLAKPESGKLVMRRVSNDN